jgi:hypothetical protein
MFPKAKRGEKDKAKDARAFSFNFEKFNMFKESTTKSLFPKKK